MYRTTDIVVDIDTLDYSGFVVQPEYIDANGHMNVGYYTLLFDKALDLPWARLGIYSQQLLESGMSSFTLESHLTYQRELKLGDRLQFKFLMLDYDLKRVHYFLQMYHVAQKYLPAALGNIATLHDAHKSRPRPKEAGHAIAIRRPQI
jgi:acyl-CoA thioester hydrolase